MPWVYTIDPPALYLDGMQRELVCSDVYSGFSTGKNNAAAQNQVGLGPIPVGAYLIGEAGESEKSGPLTMHLIPETATNTYGRSGFEVHGDSLSHPGAASHGCVVAPHAARQRMADSRDRLLLVVLK